MIFSTLSNVAGYWAGSTLPVRPWECVFPSLPDRLALINWRLAFLVYLVAAALILPAAGLPQQQPTNAPSSGAKTSTFRLKPILAIYALIGFGTLTLWLLTIQLAFHLAEIGFGSPSLAGLALGTPCLTGILIGVLYERVRQFFGFRSIAAFAFISMGLAYGLISVAANMPLIFFGLLLAGVGFGLNQPNCSAWLLDVVPAEVRGRAGQPRLHLRYVQGNSRRRLSISHW